MCIIFTYQDRSISNLSSKLVPSLSSVNCSSKNNDNAAITANNASNFFSTNLPPVLSINYNPTFSWVLTIFNYTCISQ